MRSMSALLAAMVLGFWALPLPGIAQVPGGVPAPSQTVAQWQQITSADGDFAFAMPEKPSEQRTSGTHYNLPSQSLFYVARTAKVPFFFAGRTAYHRDAALTARSELQQNTDNFAKSINGSLVSQRFFSRVDQGGKSYEAQESTIKAPNGTFRQLYLMDGKSVYGVIAGPVDPQNEADIDRFFNTLRVIKR